MIRAFLACIFLLFAVASADARGTSVTPPSGGGTPGGLDTYCQFNDAGALGGDAGCTFNKNTDVLTVGGLTVTGQPYSEWPTTAGEVSALSSGRCMTHTGHIVSCSENGGAVTPILLTIARPSDVVNLSGATSTRPVKVGTIAALPATCMIGEVYFATDATAGQNLRFCTATNTWTAMSGMTTSWDNGGAANLTAIVTGGYKFVMYEGTNSRWQFEMVGNGAFYSDVDGDQDIGKVDKRFRNLYANLKMGAAHSVTCTDTGTGALGALTITPTSDVVLITNSDTDGCDITMGEAGGALSGARVTLIVVSNAGGTVNFADTAGVTELAGAFAAAITDTITLVYANSAWYEVSRSNN